MQEEDLVDELKAQPQYRHEVPCASPRAVLNDLLAAERGFPQTGYQPAQSPKDIHLAAQQDRNMSIPDENHVAASVHKLKRTLLRKQHRRERKRQQLLSAGRSTWGVDLEEDSDCSAISKNSNYQTRYCSHGHTSRHADGDDIDS